jgi:hypothetical protein
MRPGTLVRVHTQQARHVVHQEQKIALEVLQCRTEGGDGGDNKAAYDMLPV